MRPWDDWEERLILSQRLPSTKLVVSVLAALLALWTWQAIWRGRKEAAVEFEVEKPAQLKKDYIWKGASDETADEVRDGKIYPRCPADGQPLQTGPIVPATPEDIDRAVSSAASAQRVWSQTTLVERRRVLKTLLQYVLSNQEEIAAVCCLDSGKTKIDASFGEILVTAEKLAWTSQHGEAALAPSRRPTNLLMCYKSNTVHYEPLGVVAACVSWNYPFHNLISPVISALFAGNAIVVKPSEQTAWSSLHFTSIIHGALEACGHSPDLLQTIICLPEAADHLTSHPTIKHLTFIGSRPVAHKVAASASKSLTALTAELGGKDPAIVLDDARTISDLENVTSILLRGTFQSAGQNCIGIERVIALPGIHDKLLAHVIPKIKALTLGNVLHDELAPDIGAMISSRSFPRLEALIASAVKEGAILHCGGRSYNHPKYPRGIYFQPTLLSNITPIMEIAQTELFAPVFLLMRATSVSHAIEMANSTQCALGASIFGHYQPDVRRCVSETKAGNVAVNDFGAFYVCSMPFGGRNGSGYGRFGGEEGLRALCNIKSVCEDSWWAKILGAKTQIPMPLRYPIDGSRGWQVCTGVVQTGYGIGAMQMTKGVGTLLANLMRGGEEMREREATKKVERLSRDW